MEGCADVVGVEIVRDGDGSFTFHVTVASADEGWDKYADEWVVAGPFNLILLAHIVSLLARGVRKHALSNVVYGAILLVFVAGARYVDLLQSLVARGLVFLLVGSALFAEGIYYARGSRLEEEEG